MSPATAKEWLFRLPIICQLNLHMQEIIKGAGIAFLLKIFGSMLSFGFNLALARFFGAEGAGLKLPQISRHTEE
jgi:hypothetical protein